MSIIYQDYIINVWRYNYCVELIIYIRCEKKFMAFFPLDVTKKNATNFFPHLILGVQISSFP